MPGMQIRVEQVDCTEYATPLLVLNVFEGEESLVGPVAKLDERVGGQLSDLLRRGDFRGKEGEVAVLYPASGAIPAERLLLVGVGKREKLDAERIRRAAGTAVKQAAKLRVARLASLLHHAELVADRVTPAVAAQAVAEGALLGGYAFD